MLLRFFTQIFILLSERKIRQTFGPITQFPTD